MRSLLVVGVLLGLSNVACGSGSSAPPSGQGGATGSAGSSASGGAGTSASGGAGSGAAGSGAAGSCPARPSTDLPTKINNNDECVYVGTSTAGCPTGELEYACPDNGLKIPPEAGCTHPTSGANLALRWCCTSALCSRFFSRDARCVCGSQAPNDYNCAPGATAAETCSKNASGDFCCPFTD
jgi:hypothetical protein